MTTALASPLAPHASHLSRPCLSNALACTLLWEGALAGAVGPTAKLLREGAFAGALGPTAKLGAQLVEDPCPDTSCSRQVTAVQRPHASVATLLAGRQLAARRGAHVPAVVDLLTWHVHEARRLSNVCPNPQPRGTLWCPHTQEAASCPSRPHSSGADLFLRRHVSLFALVPRAHRVRPCVQVQDAGARAPQMPASTQAVSTLHLCPAPSAHLLSQ